MALPKIPEYITGEFAHSYVAACTNEVKERFEGLQAKRGITIPNDSTILRSAQVELFMEAI